MPRIGEYTGGDAHPMADSVKLEEFIGENLELEEWSEHEGGQGPYVILRGRRLDMDGQPFKARSSSNVVMDQLRTARDNGAPLPLEIEPFKATGAGGRQYLKLR